MRPYPPMEVDVRGQHYRVAFTFEHYDPPRPGRINEGRVRARTYCRVAPPDRPGYYVGVADCSVVDRYVLMAGVRLALDRAVGHLYGSQVPSGAFAAWRAAVLPRMAEEQARRVARRSKPGLRALRRELLAAREEMTILKGMLDQGVSVILANVAQRAEQYALARVGEIILRIDKAEQETAVRE